jgi:hypothetical protein
MKETTTGRWLNAMKKKLPSAPFDLAVESFWCHTLDQQSGLLHMPTGGA